MSKAGLLGAIGGAGQGMNQVAGIMFADQLEGLRMDRMAKIKEIQDNAAQDDRKEIVGLQRDNRLAEKNIDSADKILDRQAEKEAAKKLATAKTKAGPSKWNPANGMSLQDAQKAANRNIGKVAAGDVEGRGMMKDEDFEKFKQGEYKRYNLAPGGLRFLTKKEIESDAQPKKSDAQLLSSRLGREEHKRQLKISESKLDTGILGFGGEKADLDEVRVNTLNALRVPGESRAPAKTKYSDGMRRPVTSGPNKGKIAVYTNGQWRLSK